VTRTRIDTADRHRRSRRLTRPVPRPATRATSIARGPSAAAAAAAIERRAESGAFAIRRFVHENGLSIAFLSLFFLALVFGQGLAGHHAYNDEQRRHGQPEVTYAQYLLSASFIEATAENWESEFLEMMLFTILTAILFQKGSAESKPLDEPDEDLEAAARRRDAPWPVRRGGLARALYARSLSLIFLVLLVATFFLHAASGARRETQENLAHGNLEQVGALEFIGTSKFWFQSFQNWQSEFLGISSMVVFSIWLRQRGSAESKKVGDPHSKTGKS
jgi:hypothetical protein